MFEARGLSSSTNRRCGPHRDWARATSPPEITAILRRFTRANVQHPTYQALMELGKAAKTLFLCEYLHSEALRREIQEGLNVIENWNSANEFILYGKGGEIASNRLEEQEITNLPKGRPPRDFLFIRCHFVPEMGTHHIAPSVE
jgi:hypothetical protein